MNQERLSQLLRRLPRERAAPDFSSRVMARLEEKRGSAGAGRRPWVVGLAAAAVLLLAIGVWAASVWERRQASQQAQLSVQSSERIEELRGELEALQAELEALRLLAAESRPEIGIGGHREVDYLVDLRELLQVERQAGSAGPDGARPRQVDYRP